MSCPAEYASPMPRTTLTLRQQAFAEFFIQLKGNATQAAIRAGYASDPARRGHELIRHPQVAQEIARLRFLSQAGAQMDAEWWRWSLLDYHRRAREQKDMAAEGRALAMAGQHLGLLDTRADNGSVEIANRLLVLLAQAGAQNRPALPMHVVDVALVNGGAEA